MKTLRTILCLMLTAALLSGAALAETYTAEWGDVTLNFEIDDSLRQPLDIFDAAYPLPAENPTDEERAQARTRLQKAMELTFKGPLPEIFETIGSTSGLVELYASNTDDQYDEKAGLTHFAIGYTDASKSRQYLSMEVSLDEGLSAFRRDRNEFSYPAKREDYAVEHDYMTHEEADQKAQSFMTAMRAENSPFTAVLRDWYGITHEQFSDYFNWKAEHDDFKDTAAVLALAASGEYDWTDSYDAYYLLYSYAYKGYPVCDGVRTSYAGDSARHYSSLNASTLIDRDGFVYTGEEVLFDCDYTPYADTPALTLDEALEVLKTYLGSLNGLNPITIKRVYVEYVPSMVEEDPACKYTFEPVWNFVADMTTNSGVLEDYIVYRVNGHTGEIMTSGGEIIK